jgi:hypothetical protein
LSSIVTGTPILALSLGLIKCRFGLTLVGGRECLGGEMLSSHGCGGVGVIIGGRDILDESNGVACRSMGGARVLVLEIVEPPCSGPCQCSGCA